MKHNNLNIQILNAPSILGLKPNGVQKLGDVLLGHGLADKIGANTSVVHVPTLNGLYSAIRDEQTKCLNPKPTRDFSVTLSKAVKKSIREGYFPIVLGGDCSILIGVMPALKTIGTYGVLFLDAHADFYSPNKSTTGELADMDLAIITGQGPDLLTNIDNLGPYVEIRNVIHIGQRDWEETRHYGSADIRDTEMKCFDFEEIEKKGIENIIHAVSQHIETLDVDGFWIHFDTDVLSDKLNPAVDYRIKGGLNFQQVEMLIQSMLKPKRITGLSVTIFNPELDTDGRIAKMISDSIGRIFN